MKEYLEKYPDQESDVEAAIFALGFAAVDDILKEALKKGKKVKFENDTENLDQIHYTFI